MAAIVTVVGLCLAQDAFAWWNSSWAYRRKITFTNSGNGALSNFPVLVKVNSTRINYAQTQNSGQDIRFVDADDTTLLAHQIELWNEAGDSFVWVNVSTIDNTNTDYIWMYYGNSGTADGQNATGTWNTNYITVWHMDGSGTVITDSTSSPTSPTLPGSWAWETSSAKIANGLNFTAQASNLGHRVDTGGDDGADWTLEFWYKGNSSPPAEGYRDWFVVCSGYWGGLTIGAFGNPPSKYISYTDYNNSAGRNSNTTDFGNGVFDHYTLNSDWDGGGSGICRFRIYKNGAYLATFDKTQANMAYYQNIYLGWIGASVPQVGATVDELRFSNTLRSDGWIAATHSSMVDTYGSYGSEELANTAPSAPSSLSPADGSATTDTTPTLSFTQSDADSGDTVKFRIWIDDTSDFSSLVVDYTSALIAQGATSFTVGQAVGSGTYTVGSESQTLSEATYYWKVMSTDNSSADSSWTSSRTIIVDTTDPTVTGAACYADTLSDGAAYDDDTTVGLQWTESDGSGSGIASVNACIGVTPPNEAVTVGVQSDTDIGVAGLNTYYVKVTDNVGLTSTVASDTITIDLTNPTAPGNLTFNTKTTADPGTVTLNFGLQTVDTNFANYKVYYKQAASGVTTSDTLHTTINTIDYGGASTTQITGLTPINQYYTFNIWANDLAGRASSAATEITVFVGDCTLTSQAIDYDDGVTADATVVGWGQVLWNDTETNGSISYQLEYDTDGDGAGDTWAEIPDAALSGNPTGFGTSPVNIAGLNTTTYNRIRLKATFLYGATATPIMSDWSVTWKSNYDPNTPSSQSPADGTWTNDSTPTLYFTQSDPDSGNTVKYTIYVDNNSDYLSLEVNYTSGLIAQGATSFTVNQTVGAGTYTAGAPTTTLTPDGTYYWKVMSTDNSNATSGWTTSRTIRIDTVNPAITSCAWSESHANTYVPPGDTTKLYYASTGSYSASVTLTATGASDALSGVQKVAFPNILGIGSPGNEDSSSPYAVTYTVSQSDTDDIQGIQSTVYDNAGNSAAGAAVNVYKEAVHAPSASADVAESTWQADNTPQISWTAGSCTIVNHYTVEISGATTEAETTRTSPYTPTLNNGVNNIIVRLYDELGQVGSDTVYVWVLGTIDVSIKLRGVEIYPVTWTTAGMTPTGHQGTGEQFSLTSAGLNNNSIGKYRYVLDHLASTDASGGTFWLSGTLSLYIPTSKAIYIHFKLYTDADDGPYTTSHYGPYYYMNTEDRLYGGKFFDKKGGGVIERYGF